MTFNEKNVNRDTDGRFDTKPQSAPEVQLPRAGEAPGGKATSEVNPVTGKPLPTALESARELYRRARATLQDETVREIQRIARTVPGAERVAYTLDREGDVVEFSHLQGADGEIIPLGRQDPFSDLYDLGLDLDPSEADEYVDGRETIWVNLRDDEDPNTEAKAAVARALDRFYSAEPDTDHWEAADTELQKAPVAAIQACLPDGVRGVAFAWGESYPELVYAFDEDGNIRHISFYDDDADTWGDIADFAANITSPSTYMTAAVPDDDEAEFAVEK